MHIITSIFLSQLKETNMQSRKSFITKFGELIDQHRAEQQDITASISRPNRASRLAYWLLPNGGTLILIALLIATQSVWAHGLQTPAATMTSSLTTINYQGRLADASGTPINNTNPGLGMTFALYTQQSGGFPAWSETQANVPVANGLFSVRLGSLYPLSASLLLSDLWLGIQIGTDPEMTPREKLAAVPYAMQASVALTVPDGAIGSAQIADGSVKSRDVQLTAGSVSALIPPNGSLLLQNTLQDVPGTSFSLTPDTAQKYLMYVTADLSVDNGLVLTRLYVDGTAQNSSIIFAGSGVMERGTVSQAYLVSLAPGSHTIVLKAQLNTGTSGIIWDTHTKITYFAISQ